MNKSILIKGSIIMGLFLLIIGAAVGCSLITADATEPTLSNGSDVYLTMDDYTITNQQLWDVMKNIDGLKYFNDYVDRILLEDEIKDVNISEEEIDAEVRFLIYETRSDGIISDIQENAELDQDYIDAFEQELIINGFDPSNDDDLRTYTEVRIAKAKLARQYMLDAEDDNEFAITDEDTEDYYDTVTYGDVCAVAITFESEAEASLVFDEFNLVPSFNFGIGLYTDTEVEIEDVASDGFILDENTIQLDDDQVFEQFVLIYNYMNPWATQIPEDITQADYCANYADVATYNFNDMVEDRVSGDPYTGLASYMFDTLTLDPEDEDGIKFSYSSQMFGNSAAYVYKLTEESITKYADLTDAEMLDLENEILDLIITDELVHKIMFTINEDIKLEIYDPYIALKYGFENFVEFDNKGSKTLVATIGDVDITADELFDFMEARVGTFYSIELVKINQLLTSDAYFDVFGDDYDFMNSNDETMSANRDALRVMKSTFASNGYASYGYASTQYTWEEFIYLAFSVKTESEVIQQLYVFQDLQTKVIYPTLDYANAVDYMTAQSEEYFNLNADHLLIFVDFDNDFVPDDFTEYIEGLDVAGLAEYNEVKLAFDTLLFEKLDEGLTFGEIVTEFENSLMDDPLNDWAPIKQYGFQITGENLTPADENGTVQSLTNINTESFDADFTERLKIIYDNFVFLDSNTVGGLDEYMDTQIIETSFGIHLILATKGTAFEQFSAAYDPLDTSIEGDYTAGSENDSDLPNEQQILIYNKIRYATIGGDFTTDLLPPDVYLAINQVYGPFFDAYFTQTGFTLNTVNSMFDSNVTYTNNNAESLETLQDILDILYIVNFPEEFIITD